MGHESESEGKSGWVSSWISWVSLQAKVQSLPDCQLYHKQHPKAKVLNWLQDNPLDTIAEEEADVEPDNGDFGALKEKQLGWKKVSLPYLACGLTENVVFFVFFLPYFFCHKHF